MFLIMRHAPGILLAILLLTAGCASLKVPTEGSYPFRARFDGTALVKGEEVSFQGALSVVSRDKASAQIYGPLGLVLFTMDIDGGRARLYNVWGRMVNEYDFPYDEFVGIVAGIPPDTPYLWMRSTGEGASVKYLWGSILLDGADLPRQVHVQSSPPVDAVFTRDNKIITLMMEHGSDKLKLSMDVIEGGRWLNTCVGNE
jgi:hypothetical protein